jgi:hypothetical protein
MVGLMQDKFEVRLVLKVYKVIKALKDLLVKQAILVTLV